ncbi:MAG: hypothetical protein ABIA74_01310 [bacterium]
MQTLKFKNPSDSYKFVSGSMFDLLTWLIIFMGDFVAYMFAGNTYKTIKMNKIFFFILTFIFFTPLFCNQEFDLSELLNLLGVDANQVLQLDDQNQNNLNDETQNQLTLASPFKNKKKDSKLYNDYLKKYYPKVFVAREQFFSFMKPEQIADSLQDIVSIFTYDPWFYLSNDEKKINIGQYWEFILDQLAFYGQYIEHAKVDNKTNNVFFEEKSFNKFKDFDLFDSFQANFSETKILKDAKPLKEVWEKLGIHVHHHFYALYFDYVIKMFNEGILFKDWMQVSWYYFELRKVFERLVGTTYEAEYHEHVKTTKELYDLLKIKLGYDQQSSDSDSKEDKFWNEFVEYLDF